MKQKVLITGASGFLGYHLVCSALEKGYEVYAAVRKSSDISHLRHLPVRFIELDYRDPAGMAAQFLEHRFEYVVHAAGTTKALDLETYERVNADFTGNLAKAAATHPGMVQKLVFISSLAAVGPLQDASGLIREDLTPRPVTAYGKSKLSAENKLKMTDLAVAIFRPTAIYGPRERDIFILIQQLSKGIDLYIGRSAQQLSFVYGPDMAELAINALGNASATGIYHVSDGQSYNRYAFADAALEILGKKARRIHLPMPLVKLGLFTAEKLGKMMNKMPPVTLEKLNELTAANWICDISRAQQQLGFQPRFDLQKGLEATLKWYREEQWLR